MEKDISEMIILNKKIYSNNKEVLLEFITELKEILCSIKNEKIFKKIEMLTINLNKFITDYKKKVDIEQKALEELKNKINIKKDKLKIKVNFDDGTYIGEIINGIREGKGIFYDKNGDIYDGEWKKDKKEGRGTYIYEDGDVYEGEWKNDCFEGRGIFYHVSGSVYDGYFSDDQRHGKGIYYFFNGDRYEGDWKKGNKHGQGVYIFSSGNRKMGDYVDDKEKGKHVTLTKEGTVLTDNY